MKSYYIHIVEFSFFLTYNIYILYVLYSVTKIYCFIFHIADYIYYFCAGNYLLFNFLKLMIMQIIVNCSHFDSKANEITDYQNRIVLDDSFDLDFRKLYQSLRLLYPRATFVTFKVG